MSYRKDLDLLTRHTDAFELVSPEGGRAVIAPQLQARTMTSSFGDVDAPGHGWINHELISSGRHNPHINAYGGEDRFWMGPEGGQFSIFFKAGDQFTLDDWQTPAFIDSLPWQIESRGDFSALAVYEGSFANFSGTEFSVSISRAIKLLTRGEVSERLGVEIPMDVRLVAHESHNEVINTGQSAWTREGGLLSIWVLGMFHPSPTGTVVIPFIDGEEKELGPRVNDAYFGKVPEDRIAIRDGLILFKGDGQHRSKIGVGPRRAKNVLGSWDPVRQLLTLTTYTLPQPAGDYVNSMWEMQEHPYQGDVVNSYNDGPPEPGQPPLGPFYELETSSPALALKPNVSAEHLHTTVHLSGESASLDPIARRVFGAPLDQLVL